MKRKRNRPQWIIRKLREADGMLSSGLRIPQVVQKLEISEHTLHRSKLDGEIPFNRPLVLGKEIDYISQALSYRKLTGDGHFVSACSRLLEERFGIHKVLMTPSCTAALEMAAMLCGLESGDEVIVPSYTFVSTANSVVRAGASPVFVDIRPDTLNIDDARIEQALTPRTKAIIAVHYAGVGCEMDRIMEIADNYNLVVIEDAAQGVNSFYRGRALGSIGHLATYSFHATKNYTCGEGGALCINEPEFVDRAEIIREKGTNRSQFISGKVDKYTWVDVGSSFLLSELNCAFLYAQLERMAEIAKRRQEIYEFYRERLRPLEQGGLLRLPVVPDVCESNFHIFYILLPQEHTRDSLLAYLKQQGIDAVFHYVPLHTSPMGRKYGYAEGDLPVTEQFSRRILRLPFYCGLTQEQQERIVDQISTFLRPRTTPAGVAAPAR